MAATSSSSLSDLPPVSFENGPPNGMRDHREEGSTVSLTAIAMQCAVVDRMSVIERKHAVIQGSLWKLREDADPSEIEDQWDMRDFWLAPNGRMCYFSMKEQRGLVLFAGRPVHGEVHVRPAQPGTSARPFTFEMEPMPLPGSTIDFEHSTFAATSKEEYDRWMRYLTLGPDPPGFNFREFLRKCCCWCKRDARRQPLLNGHRESELGS